MNITKKQKALTEELIDASKAYYAGNPYMSDIEYDKKFDALKAMEDESGIIYPGSPTHTVGAEVVSELKKVKHEQPALSLGKTKYADRENLIKWLKEGNDSGVIMWKCDGSTVVLTYDNGILTTAATRGTDGIEGSDITHNARFFKGVPFKIPYTGHLVVRGEAMMADEEFNRINEEADGVYENARNLATATIQMLDANEAKKRQIIFKAFELVVPDVYTLIGDDYGKVIDIDYNLQYMRDRLAWLESLGFDVVDSERCNSSDVLQKIEEWKNKITSLPYPTDGLVFSYDDLIAGWKLGSTGHHPRWAIALKWTDETVATTIRDIEWSVGKTGIITPVAIFDEVRLGLGSNVTRASLHNISIMKRLSSSDGKIKMIGAKANVYLANLIIPQVADIEGEGSEVEIPTVCPVCGQPTSIYISPAKVEVLKCDNENCPARWIGNLMNTFGKDGLFVKGLGESQLQDLIDAGLVTDALSVYELAEKVDKDTNYGVAFLRLLDQDGWGDKKWENLMTAIEASRKTTLQKFLYSLNIPLCGNDMSKKLSKFWHGDIEEFKSFVKDVHSAFVVPMESWNKDDMYYYEGTRMTWDNTLGAIDGLGNEKVDNFLDWIENMAGEASTYERFMTLIEELKFPAPEASAPADSSLEGLTFVITGNVHEYKNRDEFKASVEARGGKVAGSVSKNTTALVNNDVESTSGKNQKAKELGIEIISEDEFIARYGK